MIVWSCFDDSESEHENICRRKDKGRKIEEEIDRQNREGYKQ